VINLAMPGWDIDMIIRSFELYKDLLKPVAVVYVFCPNDLLCGIKKISANEIISSEARWGISASLSVDKSPAGFDFPPSINPPFKATLKEESKQLFLYCLKRLQKDAGNSHLYLLDTSGKSILYLKDTADNQRWVMREFSENNKESVSFIDFEILSAGHLTDASFI
jgi:hypothetical protein